MAQLIRTSSTPAMALLGSANEQSMLFAEPIAAAEHYNLQTSNGSSNTVFGDGGAAARRGGGLRRTSSNGASAVSTWTCESVNVGYYDDGDASRPPATRVTVSSPSRPGDAAGATNGTAARMRKVQSEGDLLRYNGSAPSDSGGGRTGGAASSAADSLLSSINNCSQSPATGSTVRAARLDVPPKPRRRLLSTAEALSPAFVAPAAQGLDINNIMNITLDEAVASSAAPAMHAAPSYKYVDGDVNVVDFAGGGANGGGGGRRVFHTGGGDGGGGGGGGSFRDADRTEAYYQKLLEQNPGHPLFLRNYAKYLAEVKHEYKKAEEYLERAILANPGDGELLGLYAQMILDVHRDRNRAAAYFERALQASPDDSYLAAAYASFLWNEEEDSHSNHPHMDSNNTHPAFPSPNFLISA